ncbi:MAG TPA: AAA family ATPase [Terriglobales bacterium]|jgi:predicted ATPase|nr:AAA family ATPase [Terriglobales bacterium]
MGKATDRFFVLTGGPGSGKSTLVAALRDAGYAGSVEAGRGVIQEQVAIGGRALPWDDRQLFAELMLSWDIRSYHLAEATSGLVFFDRGIPDVMGYLRLSGLPVPAHVQKAAETFRYHRRVFVAPPWEEIFATDTERKQDFAEAVRTYEALQLVYTECGYELIEIPRVPVAHRVRFVLDAVHDF